LISDIIGLILLKAILCTIKFIVLSSAGLRVEVLDGGA
jgi:hypothetical protein